jgi:methylated-DNA-protein-cysteine methyltransferase-like protein
MVLSARSEVLKILRKIPLGRVTSPDALAAASEIGTALVVTLLAQLSEDERELVPWHRVVAKGGAIGRGMHRDQQFARLAREGVMVSPAGVVQDLARHMISSFDDVALAENVGGSAVSAASKPGGRSRGMKQRP